MLTDLVFKALKERKEERKAIICVNRLFGENKLMVSSVYGEI